MRLFKLWTQSFSASQTDDTYTHVSPTRHREAAMRLDDFLSEHQM